MRPGGQRVVGRLQHRPLPRPEGAVALPLAHADQVVGGDADPGGDGPVLGPLVGTAGGPPDAHDDDLAELRVEAAPGQQAEQEVGDSLGQGLVGQQHPEHVEPGQHFGHAGPGRSLLGVMRVQHEHTPMAHGTTTPWTGGRPPPSPAMASSSPANPSRPTTRLGTSPKGYRPDASSPSAHR